MKIQDINIYDTKEVVEYVNQELLKGRSQKDIEINDFKVNEKVIKNRLSRRGYKKINNQWFLQTIENNTDYTTKLNTKSTTVVQHKPEKNNKQENINAELINKLLNLDFYTLENIIKEHKSKKEFEVIRSNTQVVTSVRVDKGIYSLFKTKAKMEGVSVGELLNTLMSNYINNN